MSSGEIIDYYGLLGIPLNSTVSEIHKAYWHKASRSHPDRGGSHEEMVRLVEAWKILSDPNKRARYDQLLKYRLGGWHSSKFNEDVQDARKGAKVDAARTWAEFEEIYQKAFYIFNQDFYGEELHANAAGPYSPLMGSKNRPGQDLDTSKSRPPGSATNKTGATVIDYMMKIVILVVVLVALLLIYRSYSGIGRYVPLGQHDAAFILMLDTTSGAVYSVEKQADGLSTTWRQTVSPLPGEKKPVFK